MLDGGPHSEARAEARYKYVLKATADAKIPPFVKHPTLFIKSTPEADAFLEGDGAALNASIV